MRSQSSIAEAGSSLNLLGRFVEDRFISDVSVIDATRFCFIKSFKEEFDWDWWSHRLGFISNIAIGRASTAFHTIAVFSGWETVKWNPKDATKSLFIYIVQNFVRRNTPVDFRCYWLTWDFLLDLERDFVSCPRQKSPEIINGLFLLADFKLARANRKTSAIILVAFASRSWNPGKL